MAYSKGEDLRLQELSLKLTVAMNSQYEIGQVESIRCRYI